MSSIADRLSSVMTAADTAPPIAPEPVVDAQPVADTASVTSAPEPAAPVSEPPSAQPAAAEFEPPELNFDDEDGAPAAPVAAAQPGQPPAKAATVEDEIDRLLAEGLSKPHNAEHPVLRAFLATNKGRQLLSLYKTERTLRESPNYVDGQNVGGIGFMPTPEQTKDWYAKASDMDMMEHDFGTNPQNFVRNWFTPDANGEFRPGTAQVLQSIPAALDQIFASAQQSGNEQLRQQAVSAYRSVAQPVIMSYLEGLYERARAQSDPQTREYYLNAARAVEFDLTGNHRPDDKLAPPTPMDALAQREAVVQQQEQRLQAWRQQSMSQAQQQAEGQIFQQIDDRLNKDLEKALSPVKTGMSERAFRAAVNDFKREVQEAVRRNHDGFRQFNFALSRARSARSADERTSAVNTYAQLSRQVITARYRQIVSELAGDALRSNAAAHQAAQNGSSLRAPAAGGAQPQPQSVVAETKVLARQPGEDNTDYIQRRFAARLQQPSVQ